MSTTTVPLQAMEIKLTSREEVLEIDASLVQTIQKIAHKQGFISSSESPADQAQCDFETKFKVLHDAYLAIRQQRDAKQQLLQLFCYGLYVYWLPPKELSWLSGILLDTGVLTTAEHRRYCTERVRMIKQSRR